ncbi:MAG: Sec-independent protein translocase protein TatB [Gammaproteobacteria bacterium]|jgi:sec-independent protein translocase protein TatB
MFSDFGTMELMLILLVTLLVIGPERLPETLRTLGLWLGRISRSFAAVKVEIEQEIGMDDIRRQLHNEQVMAEMKKIENDVKVSTAAVDTGIAEATAATDTNKANETKPTPGAP